jgi:ribosome recycling factor
MAYDFTAFKNELREVEECLGNEYLGVRTGRATPAILDSVFVESYGSRTPIKHVASVTVEDAKTIRVSPWDKSQVKAIEKAIGEANLGLGASSDAQGVRVFFPELTAERRAALIKVVREKLEHARVSVRAARDEVWGDIQNKERDGDIAEDDKFRLKDEMQKLVDTANQRMEDMAGRKEKEISE